MSETAARPLRTDAERSVRAILEAAERVLSADPGARVDGTDRDRGGVARTTIHRRFAHRQALVEALASSAARQLAQAVEDGRPDTAPPLVALHRITANVLEVKGAWAFAWGCRPTPTAKRPPSTRTSAGGASPCVYYALLGESLRGSPDDAGIDTDALAARIIGTLLHGAGPRT